MKRRVTIHRETWPIGGVFRIARGERREITALVVKIRQGDVTGRGECIAYPRYGENVEQVISAIEAKIPELEAGLERDDLQGIMPAGAARNGIDCALWDLAAKRTEQPVWQLAGLAPPLPVITAFTLSIDSPEHMAIATRRNATRPLLKLKLAGDGNDLARVAAVRDHAPRARLIVDVNEAWNPDDYRALTPELARLGVEMIEQPFPAGDDRWLADLSRPIAVCADESCHDSATLGALKDRYDVVNIKLDKTGGLTEALKLRKLAERSGLAVMVGCMVATSLAMAPAMLVAQGVRFVDLDGPLLLARDRKPGLRYQSSQIFPPESDLWG